MSLAAVLPSAIALLCLACAAPVAARSNCTDFLQDFRFNEDTLEGIWLLVHSRTSGTKNSTDDVLIGTETVSFYPLTAEEIASYSRDMAAWYPTVAWNRVKFTWNLSGHRKWSVDPYGYSDNFRFLLEFGDELARDVLALPAGETLAEALAVGGGRDPGAALRYQFKMLGDYLAVAACGPDSGYLLHKGIIKPDEAEVQEALAKIKADGLKD